ncbi:helix-turn-helix transcriptional regulator [Actinosynnema sp. NPDC047251]|uniref:Transcriptional regulator n=1 Tax=Saccharothrix espanaensis (strain ATCC 51144 / DSM 44229 / JCM 9112 / NBRC 15066 / NRRL 15764) TaxID=1179773 RepID=K0K0E9_SACES|nr:helix-turn-helix transcriptional regulator [Saccharothrix espanaensis]CCH31012.1 Transcriptional regulator [Saccharothrix espanaensis DSM 44229]
MARSGQPLPLHEIEVPVPSGLSPFAIGTFDEIGAYTRARFPHRHDFYEILYLTGGEGLHVVDFEPYPIVPNALYFLAPGQVHFWKDTEQVAGRVLVFAEEFLLDLPGVPPPFLGGSPELRLTGDHRGLVEGILADMAHEYRVRGSGYATMLQSYLHILLVRTQRLRQVRPEAPVSSLAWQFIRLVDKHVLTERSVTAYAERVGVTAGHLTDLVRAATGKTPGAVIRAALALEAKRLLARTELSAAQVAHRLAFEDASYFGRFFKRETGTSPGDFRREVREKYQFARER